MSFQVPYASSSPPSTPDKSHGLLDNSTSIFSTDGPPSRANSFTPMGPPPSSIFNSSQSGFMSKNSTNSLFTKSGNVNMEDSIFGSSFGPFDPTPLSRKARPKSFARSQLSFGTLNSKATNRAQRSGILTDNTDEDKTSEEDADNYMDKGYTSSWTGNRMSFLESDFGDSLPPRPTAALGHHRPMFLAPTNSKKPELDKHHANQPLLRRIKLSPQKDSPMKSVIRSIASRATPTAADDPDKMIVQTEDEICRMYDDYGQVEERDVDLSVTLSETSKNLATIWKSCAGEVGISQHYNTETTIGPGDHAPNIVKATFLGSLMLQLRHPPTGDSVSNSIDGVTSHNLSRLSTKYSPMPIPRMLLDWLDANHNPQCEDLQTLKELEPNPTSSPNFWEIVSNGILRGQFADVVEILQSADFNYARSALEDGLPQAGYRGTQLQNIQRCINKLLRTLEMCPGSQRNNWDARGAEWSIYRKHIITAITDLEDFAEGEEHLIDSPVSGGRFEAVNFGLNYAASRPGFSFTQSARMAESRVPWAIYQSVKAIYLTILGDAVAIINNAQDWLEATIGLAVWWDGKDDEEASKNGGLNASIASDPFRASKEESTDAAGEDPRSVYLSRIGLAYRAVTGGMPGAGFRVNSLSGIEVGLASIFEGNIDGVIELLQTWSLCVASAVAEVSSAGGWFDSTEREAPGFNDDDLMVLSYGQSTSVPSCRIHKDDILTAYALCLSERPSIDDQSGSRNGWEVALGILSRLDNAGRMQKDVSKLLDKLPLDTPVQMDKAVLLCGELGLEDEGRRISERYGDDIVSNSENYGRVLVCYARARNRRKVKATVDLLISYSLVQSRAYPTFGDLDADLRSLLTEPKTYLSGLAAVDEEAAVLLQFYFSGYATLRRFYEVRDEAVGLKDGQQPHYKLLARKRAAAQALVAVIGSAADSIYGGLYDPERDSAVQVDGLLTLLAEALVFVDQPTRILSMSQQFTILSAIEDLETVTPRVYSQCEECFRSTLLEYHLSGAEDQSATESFALPPSPRAMLKKSVSSLTGSSSFSMIGSDMLESARVRTVSQEESGSSAVLVSRPAPRYEAVQRGWDWRAGLAEDTKGEDILRILRLGLAKGVSYGAL